MQINLNTPSTAGTSTAQTVAPAAQAKTTTTTAPSTADTVTLSAEAKAKLAAETIGTEPPMTTLGNGSGNEPPIKDKDKDQVQ
ncbi:MAG TPA: hypothetical protein VJ795_01315 [Rheinheimera sp.]|uniref:hypothetical protein n=1 Tax=Rheinheimera sp. TaxID=1869214 RepID=UPI002B47ADE5|nr:hypothetical protein [Rheinheimera sp.]HJS13682.1 hypothetical protein [Rheinheimera sp.]